MSFDVSFENRIKAILRDEYPEFEQAISGEKVSALRINPLKTENTGEPDFKSAGIITDGNVEWEDSARIYTAGAPGKHPYHEAGVYYIQEPSAMAPVHFLDPKPGEKILDLCAAPGGKSTQIAARMKGQGVLVTNEIDRKRAQILSLNIERCGIRNALVTNMSPDKLSEVFEGYFDRILVDAPCSGEGMFRKNDEAVKNWSLDNVELCSKRQTDILKEAVKMLAPGGRLVYSTCTFAPEEDELQVDMLLTMGMIPVKVSLYEGMVRGDVNNLEVLELSCEDRERLQEALSGSSVRLWPHKIKGEGHFLAVFEKEGDIELNNGLYGVNGKLKGVNTEDISAFKEFCDEYLRDVNFIIDENGKKSGKERNKKKQKGKSIRGNSRGLSCRLEGSLCGTLFMFGEQLYLAPEGMPGINGLVVMRPGLHLGTLKNGRFEPSHALALAIKPENAVLVYKIEENDNEKAMQFIGGMSFRDEGLEKGWYLITIGAYSLGWAKYAGGILKNHYPKGLRIYT